ncbi:MAG: 4-hydroxythreonine-4-phosphate dehydrogenase PdxA, partial [Gammaproteobacteria bacterium]|nr:4-hydroxythreonine-4-phosphate dehydrogenase PdxA [Gammaproteobacteria bacterium]
MSSQQLPRIGITLGDPAGIGPEVLVKALPEIQNRCHPVLYGSRWAAELGAEISKKKLPNELEVSDVDIDKPSDFEFGTVHATCGQIAIDSVTRSAIDALEGRLDAIMTCPLNKEAIHAAGSNDIGHQEILGRLANSTATATMLMTPGLRVVHLSTHKSLGQAVEFVTQDNVLQKIVLCADSFRSWGMADPRIAVSALNPHGGEGGLLGREEIEELAPAVEQAQSQGIHAVGPIPADSVFNRAINGEFDVVIALYHDQGHIAIKVHNFHESISATLGLPFIRTSVDHGTAFDIAGKGIANPKSTIAAIDAAIVLANGQLG